MAMRKVTLTELSRPVRSFLSQVRKGKSLMVEDEQGRARYGVVLYEEAPKRQQDAALRGLARLQAKVGKTMKRRGRTEADFDRLLQGKS